MIFLYSEALYKLYLTSGMFTQFFYLLLFLMAIWNYHFFNREWRWVFALYCTYFIFEHCSYLTMYYGWKNDHFFDHLYLIVAVIFLRFFLYKVITNTLAKKIIRYGLPTLIVALAITGVYKQGYLESPILLPLKNILFLGLHMLLHSQLIKTSKPNKLKTNPLFWWNLAYILMNGYYVFFSVIANQVTAQSDDLAFIIFSIKNLIDPVCCVLWMISIWKLRSWKLVPTTI